MLSTLIKMDFRILWRYKLLVIEVSTMIMTLAIIALMPVHLLPTILSYLIVTTLFMTGSLITLIKTFQEKKEGVFRSLVISPMSKWMYFGSKILVSTILNLIMISIPLIVAIVRMNAQDTTADVEKYINVANLMNNVGAVVTFTIIVTIAVSAFSAAVGMLVTFFSKDFMMAMMFVGLGMGLIVNLDVIASAITGDSESVIWYLIPLASINDSFNTIVETGNWTEATAGVTTAIWTVASLVIYSLLSFVGITSMYDGFKEREM